MANPSPSSLRSRLNSAISGLTDQLPAINSLQHSIRQQVVTHNPSQNPETLKLQLAITAQSAVVRDEEALAREQLAASKAVFLWGQANKASEEVVDVTDRMAFLLYSTGEQFAAHARSLEQSRMALKDIRKLEDDLVPRRRAHSALTAKLSALECAHKPKDAAQIAQLRGELIESHQSLDTFESSLAAVRRQKLREGFSLQFAAQRELGEKLAIIASYGEVLLQALDGLEGGEKYGAQELTAAVRLEAAEAVKKWSPSNAYVPTPIVGRSGESSLGRSDTRSFGSTHADALSHIGEPNLTRHPESTHSTSPARQSSMPPSTPPTQGTLSTLEDDTRRSITPHGSIAPGGINRMATTDRRRLQHSEQQIGAEEAERAQADPLPEYALMDEEETPEERERREAELVEARRREAKRAEGTELQ